MKITFISVYFSVLIILAVYSIHRYYLVYLYYKNKNNKPVPEKLFSRLPKITVQLPVYNELYVVDRLIDAVCAVDYPRDLLDIQVLDDSEDETTDRIADKVAEMKKEGFNIGHFKRDSREGYKAGALDYGLRFAQGEYIAIFDADFVPTKEILQKTIHYFTDEKIGMVQVRWGHINRNYSLLTQIQSIFLDGHLMIEHTARNRSGRFFNFNGTAGLWRKQAIIDAGGWQADTLTEDLDLSYRSQLAGWKFVYLPDLVTPAEVPIDLKSFKAQQYRWAKGAIQTAKKLLPVIWKDSKLPLKVKVEATFHLTDNIAYVLLLLLSVLLLPALSIRLQGGLSRVLFIDIPLFLVALLSFSSFYVCSQKEIYGRWWTRAKYLPVLTAIGIGMAINNARATLEALCNYQTPFNRTPKYGVIAVNEDWKQKKYKTLQNAQFLIEIIFGIYFSVLIFIACLYKQFIIIPFLMLFQIGFLYTGLVTLLEGKPVFNLLFLKKKCNV